MKPVSGEDALAPLSITRPMPDRYAVRPASMAFLKAPAIAGISPAVAIAVFAITAAAPISMASHACEGLPIPASTIIGRSISSIKIWINSRVASPLFDPIDVIRDAIKNEENLGTTSGHLAGEILGARLITIHNLYFLINLMRNIREAIKEERFLEFREEFYKKWKK